MCQVHDAIIAKGFRETGTRAAQRKGSPRFTCYTRGDEEIRYNDYGPGSQRYVMQYFKGGHKRHGGTAWQSILAQVPATVHHAGRGDYRVHACAGVQP